MLVAVGWEEPQLHLDNFVRAGGGDASDDELTIRGEEVGELGRGGWIFCRVVDPAAEKRPSVTKGFLGEDESLRFKPGSEIRVDIRSLGVAPHVQGVDEASKA